MSSVPSPTQTPIDSPSLVSSEGVERGSGLAARSYVNAPEEHRSNENDRRLLTTTEPESPLAPHDKNKGIIFRLSSYFPSVPSFPLLRCITFDYPSLYWRRLGKVRLPEDEETTICNDQPKAPSRFAGGWVSLKKKGYHLRWWHYVLVAVVILSATVPPIVVSIVRHVRKQSFFRLRQNIPQCPYPAEFSLRLDQSVHRQGGHEYLRAATTTFSVPADIPFLGLGAADSHGSVRFVLDNSTSISTDPRHRNITIDITAYMDDWDAFQRSIVVCRTTSYVPYDANSLDIHARPRFAWTPLRSAFDVTVFARISPLIAVRLMLGALNFPLIGALKAWSTTAFPAVSDWRRNDKQPTCTWIGMLMEFTLNKSKTTRSSRSSTVSSKSRKLAKTLWSCIGDDADPAGRWTTMAWAETAHSSRLPPRTIAPMIANANARGQSRVPSIGVTTANRDIEVDAMRNMHASGGYAPFPSLTLYTTNRAITANVSFDKGYLDSQAFKIPINARTTNAPIDLSIAAEGRFDVTTNNAYAPTRVRLPDAYVGGFSLSAWSGWQQPVVHFDQEHDRLERVMRVSSLSDRDVMGTVWVGNVAPPYYMLPTRVSMSAQNGELDLYL